ncbi:hypothetical protein LXA43DRAFT_1043043 [Ganoderma leucocontextum]|nr:hypothetical protein LXA43DRAFT_1043043 [Ganoderma leucocontextum]
MRISASRPRHGNSSLSAMAHARYPPRQTFTAHLASEGCVRIRDNAARECASHLLRTSYRDSSQDTQSLRVPVAGCRRSLTPWYQTLILPGSRVSDHLCSMPITAALAGVPRKFEDDTEVRMPVLRTARDKATHHSSSPVSVFLPWEAVLNVRNESSTAPIRGQAVHNMPVYDAFSHGCVARHVRLRALKRCREALMGKGGGRCGRWQRSSGRYRSPLGAQRRSRGWLLPSAHGTRARAERDDPYLRSTCAGASTPCLACQYCCSEDIVRDATPRMPRLAEVYLFLVFSCLVQAAARCGQRVDVHDKYFLLK